MFLKKPLFNNLSIAILMACLVAVLLTITAPAVGLTWDEPAYIAGAESAAAWFGLLVRHPLQALGPAEIERYWTVNSEHPPVEKIWSGLVWSLARVVFDDLTANRLGVMLGVAGLVAMLYWWIASAYGRAAGLFAALALLSLPRFFFHAHLAALDVPAAVGAFAVTFLFWKTVDRRGWAWGLLWGIAWGLAVAVKLNGVFIPVSLAAWCLLFRRERSILLRFLLMGVSAFAVFVLIWPWLYHDTWNRLLAYIDFHVHHFPIGQWYFDKFTLPPPWHFVPVMLYAVVPLTVLLLALAGMARAGKGGKDRGLAWLLVLSALVSISPFLFGKVLLYDNDRLYMPVYPFLAALAGIGFGWLIQGLRKLLERLKRPRLALPLSLLLGLALLLPQSAAMARQFPHLLSYYSEGVGGLRGATKLGLESTYWCETYAAALPYINAHARPGDTVWVEPWSYDVLLYYQLHGRLRPDLLILNPEPAFSVLGSSGPQPFTGFIYSADWIIFQNRQTQLGPAGLNSPLLAFLKNKSPVYELRVQGVPLMRLYRGK